MASINMALKLPRAARRLYNGMARNADVRVAIGGFSSRGRSAGNRHFFRALRAVEVAEYNVGAPWRALLSPPILRAYQHLRACLACIAPCLKIRYRP